MPAEREMLITVPSILPVLTTLEASFVPVTRDTVGMDYSA